MIIRKKPLLRRVLHYIYKFGVWVSLLDGIFVGLLPQDYIVTVLHDVLILLELTAILSLQADRLSPARYFFVQLVKFNTSWSKSFAVIGEQKFSFDRFKCRWWVQGHRYEQIRINAHSTLRLNFLGPGLLQLTRLLSTRRIDLHDSKNICHRQSQRFSSS